MKKTSHKSQQKTINLLFIVFCCFFLSVFGRFIYIVYSGEVAGVNIQTFAHKRNQKKEITSASRGLILDSSQNYIAQNIPSFKLVAVLSENQLDENGQPAYVVDKETTAKEIARILGAPETFVKEQLQSQNSFQVEFGKYGKDLTLDQKAELERLKLPGLDFVKSVKRYYPNDQFASNVVGFTSFDESSGKTLGRQGLEAVYETELAGKNGERVFSANAQGMPIDESVVSEEAVQNGYNLETTIDGTMQRFVEQTLAEVNEKSDAESSFAILMNPNNGKILAMAQTPSFNPNKIENVNSNIFTDRVYEIGSVMKPITIASAIEDNRFNENTRYVSGSYTIDDVTIYDYEKKGWGELTYRDILCHSSNTGISDLLLKQYPADMFKTKLDTLGFSKPADPMKNIVSGKGSTDAIGSMVFNTNIERVTTGFGQGTTSTLMQLLRSYTAIANDGVMVEPYLVDKVVNPNTGETFSHQPASTKVLNKTTAQKVRTLMVPVTETPGCTSNGYKMNGVTTAGKSGTSQIIGENGKYLEGDTNTLSSFIGMVPAQKPELMLYTGVVKSKNAVPGVYNREIYTKIMSNALNYYGITEGSTNKVNTLTEEVPNYVGQKVDRIRAEISQTSQKIAIIGNGQNIIYQSIPAGTIRANNQIILITDGTEFLMPDVKGWSKKDIQLLREYFHLSGFDNGSGLVQSQSISPQTIIREGDVLDIQYK